MDFQRFSLSLLFSVHILGGRYSLRFHLQVGFVIKLIPARELFTFGYPDRTAVSCGILLRIYLKSLWSKRHRNSSVTVIKVSASSRYLSLPMAVFSSAVSEWLFWVLFRVLQCWIPIKIPVLTPNFCVCLHFLSNLTSRWGSGCLSILTSWREILSGLKKKKNSTKKASKETNKKHQKAVIIWAAKCLVLYLLNLASGNYRVPVSKSYNWPW